MRLVLSPYELSARSVAAMAALLLGSDDQGVVTLLPAPDGGSDRQAVRDAAVGAPAFVRLMEAWRWTGPLWNAGVLSGSIDGRPVLDVVREVSGRVARSPWGAALAPFLNADILQPGHESLHAIARDLLRGGGDPAVAIPVAAALESLASEHGLVVVRQPLPSVVSRFEPRGRAPLARLAIPALAGASGESLIEIRERLATELGALRAELTRLFAHASDAERPAAPRTLLLAADAFEHAFRAAAAELRRSAFEHGRFKPAMLAIELGLVPADESLAAGARALGMLSARTAKPSLAAPDRAELAVSRPMVARITVRQSPFDVPL